MINQSVRGQLTEARVAILRNDWNSDDFGSEVSFWSRSDPQIFSTDGVIARDGALESLVITLIRSDVYFVVSIVDGTGTRSLDTFTVDRDDDLQQFAGARSFIADALMTLQNDESLADDSAWLILVNGTDIMNMGGWRQRVVSEWYGDAGEGDQLQLLDCSFAGGVFLDIVSNPHIQAKIGDSSIEYDEDFVIESRDESSRFVGVGVAIKPLEIESTHSD